MLKFAVLHSGAHKAGCEIRLHDAVRKTQAIAVRLHQVEPVSPGDGQPDIKMTMRKLLIQKALNLAVDFRIFRPLALFPPIGWLTFVVILVLDVDSISQQPDAGQRGKPLDGGFTFVAVQRHGAHQMTVE
jgi:hypothetical protein